MDTHFGSEQPIILSRRAGPAEGLLPMGWMGGKEAIFLAFERALTAALHDPIKNLLALAMSRYTENTLVPIAAFSVDLGANSIIATCKWTREKGLVIPDAQVRSPGFPFELPPSTENKIEIPRVIFPVTIGKDPEVTQALMLALFQTSVACYLPR